MINIIAFYIICIDKRKAINKKWRISEKFIFFISFIGGSLGTYVSMFIFRHKIKKWYFIIGIPCIIILQISILFAIFKLL
jgi:uncharacterized membrane protein YsdA (DUF1294 family)